MSPAQKRLRELLDRQSHDRQRGLELAQIDELDDAQRTELDTIEKRSADTERQLRAARAAVEDEDRQSTIDRGNAEPDAEMRARIELRSRAAVGRYLSAALRGRLPDGAERELGEAAGLEPGQIPFELWQRPPAPAPEHRDAEHRAITPAPSTVGVNLDVLRPYVFAPSVVDKLMCDMPTIPSGTFASGTISTSATAGAVPKGGSGTTGDVPETAASFTVTTSTPHRIGASLQLSLEDVAAVGQQNFESLLREHLSLAVSDELDDQMLNGDGQGDNITGFFQRLTDPSAPAANVETWTRFLAIQSGGIDGLWATELSEIGLIVGPDTYRLAAATFQGTDSEESAASYLKRMGSPMYGFVTNSRMPDTASNVQQGILCRKGRSMMPNPMRTAVCGSYGYFTVDDIYTGAQKGQRRFVINTLITDVILVQPDAYAQVSFRVSV